MSKSVSAPVRIRRIASLIIALALVLNWTTVAHAQSLEDAQYNPPTATASGNPAASGSTAGGGGGGGAAKAGGSGGAAKAGGSGGAAKAGGSGGAAKAGGGRESLKVLPSTGGPLLPLVVLGAIALSSASLLVLRQLYRR